MKKKEKEINYYDVFIDMVSCSLEAAQQLEDLICDFTNVPAKAEAIHATEHKADNFLHEMIIKLNQAFITPIDREDIMHLTDKIDSITDVIEDTSNLFDVFSISFVRPEAALMASLIVKSCETLKQAIVEFKSFKVSKALKEHIIEVNRLEEEGDRLHRKIIKDLYCTDAPTIEVMKWKEIYDTMEAVLDLCEDTADMIENVTVKNS